MKTATQSLVITVFVLFLLYNDSYSQNFLPVVPDSLRGHAQFERMGQHDANNIRTRFFNFGMVGDYPPDPQRVDLSVFHSVEIPKGSGENYSDGTTPFVLAKVTQEEGTPAYIMETGFRERQGTSPYFNRDMRFEPRPGYFQPDPAINTGRSSAMSNDPRTWPDEWIDKLNDPDDPGWRGWWNGYFGKIAGADQESYVVYDDNYYDAWDYFPDSRDRTRHGLGLRIEQRGFQWSNPQAGNVIFFHYDISNESTTSYTDNMIFGLYMDAGVGGSGIGKDGIPESDDDNAFFDKEAGLNLVYTWDKNNRGMIGTTGYLGYSYLETPGNPHDGIDNDQDGIIDEKRDGGAGQLITGQDQIRAYVQANYNLANFEAFHGKLDDRPAFKIGVWWTGDEDLDWLAEFHDTGADGIFGTNDTGEGDGKPTSGEPSFDRTDIDESDQIGLTGFKMNRIRAGAGSPTTEADNIVFFDDGRQWPKRLYENFNDPDSAFDKPLVLNYNIGFLFASGTFTLNAGQTERFSLALGFGRDLRELRTTTKVVQQIYEANYQFAVPPPMPTVQAFEGEGFVTLTWDDAAERAYDPVSNTNDFEGYRIYRSTDPAFLDPRIIYTATGTSPIGNGKPIAQFDIVNDIEGFSKTTVEGVSYFLGNNSGIYHTFTDSNVVNGQLYYYAVTAYDRGSDSIEIYPSENAIAVSQTLRGGTILPKNVAAVRPNARAAGYTEAGATAIEHSEGRGTGEVSVQVLNSSIVPDNHTFKLVFINSVDSVRAARYSLIDETAGDTLFLFGNDLSGTGQGPVGKGIMPVISTPEEVTIDTINSGFNAESGANVKMNIVYAYQTLTIQLKRPGFPENFKILFSDQVLDTSIAAIGIPAKPVKFRILSEDESIQYNFRFFDSDNSGTLSDLKDYIEIVTYTKEAPAAARATWTITLDTTGTGGNITLPAAGDVYTAVLNIPFSSSDIFRFTTTAEQISGEKALAEFEGKPYVVPNPYVGAASFEPQRFAVSGRGERRIEFRGLSQTCTIRIYTVTGELVQTLIHDSPAKEGYEPWDLRTKDNLEAAPGLYIYHIDAGSVGTHIGKFAIIK